MRQTDTQKKFRIGPRTRAIIDAISEGIDILTLPRGQHLRALRYGGLNSMREAEAVREYLNNYQAIQRMKKQQLIHDRKVGGRIVLALTTKGQAFAQHHAIIAQKRLLSGKRYCLVSFDIPERERSARDALRWLFRRAEFICVHRSVWMTRKDVVDDLATLVKQLGAEKWVTIFVAEKKS